ncbi:S8 family peptidase [Halorussus litoreus]|uniref:S8 family peptidase n=1 Tax=Halorussus litoreus TaxID=1710536 RepID=UPI000E2338B5|nr:S8 family serine peptidase [Halorussus litoreus]
MSDHSRRTFLKAAGTAAGSAALLSGGASASGAESTRFLIDLDEVSRSEVPDDVEIVHDISQIGVLAARGDPDAVPGASSTTPDLTAYQDGPVKEHTPSGAGEKGPAWDSGLTNTELQWDKREQRVGDLTERPDNRRVVHDTTEGEGTRVAVVDSGVYDGHPDLADVVNDELSANYTTDSFDFRPNGAGDHGTHVAGIIAATNADGAGVLGTAPETEIVAHRVFSGVEGGGATTGDILAALTDAADKSCDVANFSVGYTNYDVRENPDLLLIKQLYENVADYAHSQGMTIVNSAGNSAVDMRPEHILSLPTEAEGIFGVSATGPIGYLWDDKQQGREDKALKKLGEPTSYPANYTNYGTGVDVSAAGGNYDTSLPEGYYYDLVFSTIVQGDGTDDPESGYGWKAGTSMSAPQVTGAYALVKSLRPDASPQEVEQLIKDTAEEGEPGGELYHGAGHLDLRNLVKEARK